MKQTLTLMALIFAFASTVLVAQNRTQRGTPVVDPTASVVPGSVFKTSADTTITSDTTTVTLTIDMFGAERKPAAAPVTWARVFNTADPNNSKVDISPIFFGWPDPVDGQPIVGNYRGVGVEYNTWVTMDSTLYSIPAEFTINSVTFPARTVVNRQDGEADTFVVSVHPLSYLVNGGGNIELKPNLDTTMFEVNHQIFAGNASNGLILAAPPNPQGQYSFYISSSPISINIGHTVTDLNLNNYDPGFALFVQFKGAAVDTVMMPGWAYEQYTAAPPATVADTWETSGYLEHYNVYYRYTNTVSGDIVQDFDTLAGGWFNDASLQHFDMKVSVSYDVITFDTVIGRVDVNENSLVWGNPYPNPAANGSVITVPFRNTQMQGATVTMVNTLGQVVQEINYNNVVAGSHRIEVPVQNLTPGVYFLRLNSPSGSVVKRVVVN